MTRIVVIDDDRTFKSDEDVIYLRNSKDAIFFLVQEWTSIHLEMVDQLWLDHDLGGDDTIKPVIDFLDMVGMTDFPMYISSIFVHTQNPAAGDSMVRTLSSHYSVARVALPQLI